MERDDRDVGEKGGGGECLRHYGTSAELRRLRFTDGNYKVSLQSDRWLLSHGRVYLPSAPVFVQGACCCQSVRLLSLERLGE